MKFRKRNVAPYGGVYVVEFLRDCGGPGHRKGQRTYMSLAELDERGWVQDRDYKIVNQHPVQGVPHR